jgi:hypothetical protein
MRVPFTDWMLMDFLPVGMLFRPAISLGVSLRLRKKLFWAEEIKYNSCSGHQLIKAKSSNGSALSYLKKLWPSVTHMR